jgi:hypothetical protein
MGNCNSYQRESEVTDCICGTAVFETESRTQHTGKLSGCNLAKCRWII